MYTFVDEHAGQNKSILDLGCGKGRDALIFVRRGYSVLGVDIFPVGVRQMIEQAKNEGLDIRGEIADILTYRPPEKFDITILDRVLHMLDSKKNMITVIEYTFKTLKEGGYLLLSDEHSNMPTIHRFFDRTPCVWKLYPRMNVAFYFVQKNGIH